MATKPRWLHDNSVQLLLEIARMEGIELRFVGGCVRDFVMERDLAYGDIDLATPHLPDVICQAFAKHGRVIPTGIAHGTVTVMLEAGKDDINQHGNNNRGFEITTLRRDVQCDGRHATIEFVDDWEVDALRRDFTMNALFMNDHGEIIDYVGGVADAIAGRVRFIGDANARIAEDYLRILRYYRFLATHGKLLQQDDYAYEAIAKYAHKLVAGGGVSGERIGHEMTKMLGADNPYAALELMAETKVWQVITGQEITGQAVTGDAVINLTALRDLIDRELIDRELIAGELKIGELIAGEGQFNIKPNFNPWRRLCALISSTNINTQYIANNWRLTNVTKKYMQAMANAHMIKDIDSLRVQVAQHGKDMVQEMLLLQQDLAGNTTQLLQYLHDYQPQPCPVNGALLLQNGFSHGIKIKYALESCNDAWLQSDFSLSMEQLLVIAAEHNV